jgi:hypothetical protein
LLLNVTEVYKGCGDGPVFCRIQNYLNHKTLLFPYGEILRIKAIKITPETVLKVFDKHSVLQEELYEVLHDDAPEFRSVGGGQYVAIGLSAGRYITVFFRYDEMTKEAEITTAYPSPPSQIKSYKRMKK